MSSQYYEILSHIEPNRSLKNHLINSSNLAINFIESIPVKEDKDILREIVRLIGLYHDIGKATPAFQEYIREKDEKKKAYLKNNPITKHSLISAIFTFFVINKFLDKENYKGVLRDFYPYAAFIAVRRHHTNLQSIYNDIIIDDEQKNVIKTQIRNIYIDYLKFLPYWDEIYEKLKKFDDYEFFHKHIFYNLIKKCKDKYGDTLLYLLQQLFSSILLDADRHEASIGQFFERKEIQPDIVDNYKKIKFDNISNEIDRIRNEIYN